MVPVFRWRASPFQNDNGSHPESLEAILLLNSDRVASRAIIAIKHVAGVQEGHRYYYERKYLPTAE